jgi:hypothetical protein
MYTRLYIDKDLYINISDCRFPRLPFITFFTVYTLLKAIFDHGSVREFNARIYMLFFFVFVFFALFPFAD